MRPRRGPWQSIRFRITAIATVLVALVLVIAGVAILVVQRHQLFANLDSSLEQRADLIEAEIAAGAPSGVGFANSSTEDRFAQLVDASGVVVGATENLEGAPAVADPPEADERLRTVEGIPIEDDSYRLLSRRLDRPAGPLTLHVGQNADDVQDAVRVLSTSLVVAVPALAGLLGVLVWWLVGRTLRPVEEIRSEVATIGAAELGRRVPEPRSDDEIARLAATMNDMLERIEVSSRRQQQFVADASHELRTPLTRMRTELEVDQAEGDRADLEATHRSLLEEVLGMQALVEDLLHLARSDAGAGRHRHQPVDLDDVVTGEVQQLRLGSQVDIEMSAVRSAVVVGDPDELRRAVRNLVHNATRHADRRVTVSLTEDDGDVLLVVDDDGAGIGPRQRDQVFERFSRLDSARSKTAGGTGLGLAITRDIVERHRGSVVVDDSPTGGARFVVRMPSGDHGAPAPVGAD